METHSCVLMHMLLQIRWLKYNIYKTIHAFFLLLMENNSILPIDNKMLPSFYLLWAVGPWVI